jgi:hypothetical protein
MSDDDSDWVA